MSRIVKLKRKPLPSSPTRNSLPTSSSKPSPSKLNSPKAEQRFSQFGRTCPVCKTNIINRNGSFKRHVERHAKLAKLQAANINVQPVRAQDPEFDVALARDMWMSTPAKHRAAGGVFLDGPLAGKGDFEGMPDVFLPNGRVKNRCIWIKKDLEAGRIGRSPLKALKNTNATAGSFDEGVDMDGEH
ncbi:hypothetical protein FSARC_5749 [Fusarium sarcochroum]|uniref:Uncharacterized protein n=1 Tax=Fusarium sarcochroum TaxID=1208366 RepID=A0A8H4TYQ4_9HYPO|nr:hypothetical protein FSARC_5749 [Fusarium sarcochroum]